MLTKIGLDNLETTVKDAVNAVIGGAVGAGVESYDTIGQLPLAGVERGSLAYVAENNRLYLWNGTGWFNIALINTNPTITQGPNPSYAFATNGTPIVLTLVASDPEGIPITWSSQVTSGTLGNTATISQNGNVFTITPSTNEADVGSFGVTFTASDGVNIATAVSNFSLAFSFDFLAEYLVIAGGGGGGGRHGGGGGAGGYRAGSITLTTSNEYAVTVGAGGAGSSGESGSGGTLRGSSGSNSVLHTIISAGGGGGAASSPALSGGSGGGGGYDLTAAGFGNTPAVSPSQGNNGGLGGATSPFNGGGGGGAGQVGGNAGSTGGAGGAGVSSSITGTAVTRAGGGGGGGYINGSAAGVGGAGGGGAGGYGTAVATSGQVNTGGGGGGAGGGVFPNNGRSGSGGSGVVILKYANTLTVSNPDGGLTFTTSTAVNGFKVTTFTAGIGNIVFS